MTKFAAFRAAVAEDLTGVNPLEFIERDEAGPYMDLWGAKYLTAVLTAAERRGESEDDEEIES